METLAHSASRIGAAAIATLLGIAFFNAIIGVFGLPTSLVALVIFVALALLIFRRPQDGSDRL